mmetsp:Transcript_52329/g.123653  ORF Transcript_52329/g.123653 Transcript_52329/m.123653 type:complete len:203 (+) Transcript_52329:1485-2093(+)
MTWFSSGVSLGRSQSSSLVQNVPSRCFAITSSPTFSMAMSTLRHSDSTAWISWDQRSSSVACTASMFDSFGGPANSNSSPYRIHRTQPAHCTLSVVCHSSGNSTAAAAARRSCSPKSFPAWLSPSGVASPSASLLSSLPFADSCGIELALLTVKGFPSASASLSPSFGPSSRALSCCFTALRSLSHSSLACPAGVEAVRHGR